MVARIIADLLRMARPWPVYFEGDNIWGFGLHLRRPTMRRFGSLSAILLSKSREISRIARRTEVLKKIVTICDLEFCLCQLVPYLRLLVTEQPEDLKHPSDVQDSISRLAQEARVLELRISRRPPPALSASRLRSVLEVPCAVFGGVVIPMSKVATPGAQADVEINGAGYRYSAHRVRQLNTILVNIDKAFHAVLARDSTVPSEDIIAVQKCLERAESLLSDFCTPVAKGAYRVIYKDDRYELQYSGGRFMLVTGPLQNRINGRDSAYVGIPISTRPLLDRTRMTLLRASTAGGMWAGAGLPIGPNICLGGPHQYSKLRMLGRTNAAAILDWLDVGVNLATGRSTFYRQWRNQRQTLSG